MKRFFSMAAMIFALFSAIPAHSQELTGDTRLACEAILCLSSGTRPSECSPSLERYFGISHDDWSDTLRDRLNFLNLCPVSNQTTEMQSLVVAITNGAGRCDVNTLNSILRRFYTSSDGTTKEIRISNQLPNYCKAYTGHEYTDFNSSGTLPRYVGVPQRGGYWVEARNYDKAFAEYNERIRREDSAKKATRTNKF